MLKIVHHIGDWPKSLDCTDLNISVESAVMQNCVTSVTNKQTNKLSFCWNVQPETQILNELEPTYLVSIRWACWWMEAPLYFHICTVWPEPI